MKNKALMPVVALLVFLGIGCAQVQVKAPKEPIKVDITMRLDIYQHVEKDIDDIESIVSGKSAPKPKGGMQINFLMVDAHAQEGLPPEVEEAALRRRDRRDELVSWEAKGAIGENGMGLTEIRSPDAPAQLVSAENADRMIIYKAISQKNGALLEDVQRLYAKRLQEDASAGTPIQVTDSSGNYSWKIK